MGSGIVRLRSEIIRACRRLDSLGYVPATDGNISARAGRGRLLITPSMVPKGIVRPEQLLVVDLGGRVVSGKARPSSEMKMHLEVYRQMPEVGAVVHAHPPTATAFAACHLPLEQSILPEAIIMLGPVPLAPYATPSTSEVGKSIAPLVKKHNALLLSNHGALAYGKSVQEALERMERLEHLARVTLIAKILGGAKPLNAAQKAELKRLFG